MNIHELDSYNLGDAVKFHRRLNPRIWGRDEHLLPEVRNKLLAIAADFQEFLGVDDLTVKDITISGSNAAYSYTKNSDIDLHLVVEMPADPVYQELFNAKKYQYNDEHNIRIGGADVELYVQPADQAHHSLGIYSVKNGDWISVPQRKRAQINDACVRDKVSDLDARIHSAIQSKDLGRISTLWDKIKVMRQSGLEQHGEFGCENIAFKLLRNKGCIAALKDAKTALQDLELSLREANKPRPRFRYGFGEDMEDPTQQPYSSADGVAPTTKSFLESNNSNNSIVQDFIQQVTMELGIDPMPEIHLHTDPDWSENNHSFGRYDPDSHTLNVSMPNRHVMDVLRTVAHELVHCSQNQQHGSLPDDAGETGSRWENDANARAGIIMRDWANSHPEHFAQDALEEGASGYIPKNKREAARPQYAMALSVDIKPGQTGKEANKLALNTGRNGEPGLLMKSVNLREYKMPQPSQGPGRYKDLNEPLGPETPPKMPSGTVKVDVSDTQDWYQLGQDISNLDIANKAHYNQGPPHTVLAFGSEDLEHMYIQQLKKLGLNTHDLDEPGEEDMDENTEKQPGSTGVEEGLEVDVPNENWLQDKIDYAQSKGRNRYGVPYMGTTTAYTSQNQRVPVDILRRLPGMRGEQQNVRQQDLEAIIKIMKDTGKLPTMDNGKEYAPFINVAWNGEAWVNDGNHRIMAAAELGFKDLPVQISYFDGGERVESGAMYPGRIGLGGIAENFADGENPVKFTVSSPDGYQHSFQITLAVHGKHVGHFNFVRSADTDDVNNEAEVEQRWQGQGYGKLLLMKAIDVANNHGLDFQQDIRGITDAQQNVYDSLENAGLIVTPGDGFWFLTPQGEQELNGLNENFADGKNPGRKGLSKRVGVNTKASVSDLRKTAKNSSGEKQRMAHWLANMKAGRAKAKRK